MKKRLFITACLMLLCTFMFGQHWPMNSDVVYSGNMTVFAEIAINNEKQTSTDIELAAFCKGVVRGTVKPKYNSNLNKYIAALEIAGDINGEVITFKIFDPAVGTNGKEFYSDYTIEFENDMTIGTIIAPQTINFYDRHWICDSSYDNVMTVVCSIIIDGVEQNRTDLEMAAFYGNEVRGVAKPVYWTGPNIYLTSLVIGGSDGERIDFKVYDPIQGIEIPTEYYVTFVNDAMIGEDAPLSIEFITTPYVAQVGDKKYQSLEAALKALTDGSTLTILEDITISKKWDNRYTGAKVGVPVTIDGNGKTIKFTGEINDAGNYTAAFRFENAVTIKNLKIDMSEAISGFPQRLSAVAAKLGITVDACTFLGNANYNNTKAIIFGEGAGSALADVKVSITESHFENWKYGVSDNQNAQDAKNVTIVKNVFKDASVNVSASEFVMFDENKLDNGNVTITSYTNNTALKVEAIKNTLDATKENSIKVDPTDNINAQEGFLLPVAKIGSKYYLELNKAFAAAKAGDVVTVFEGTYTLPAMKAGITVEGAVNADGTPAVLFEGTLTSTLENLTMKNIHIKGGNAQRWAYAKGNLVFENVTFEATSVYALHFDGIAAGTNLTYKNCTIIGWAALGGTPASCIFEGCTIKGNGSYGLIRTYFNTTINDCTFDVANVNTTDVYQDGIHAVGENTTVTVTNCTNSHGEMIDLVNVSGYSVVDLDGTKIMNVAMIAETEKHYWTVTEAINAAQGGQTVQLLARTINEVIAPWAGDSQHTSEKSITIVGAKDADGNLLTTLKGGLFLGYNDGTVRDNAITVKDINFVGKGVTVANQKNVIIEGNKFTNINALVSEKHANSGSAILVIGSENNKSIDATVKNNVIENVTLASQAGIYMSQVANVTVEGNAITRTTHNAITISAATDATINVKNNTLAEWGVGGEGRAMRISGGAIVNVNGNVMSNANAPEEFVKITGAATIDASANYWNGNTPLAEKMFLTDLTIDPVSILKSYYTDSAKQNLVTLSASVAKIGDKYYQTLEAALEAAESGATIELLADINPTEVILLKKSLTINGNDHKVTSSATRVFRVTTSNTEVTLNDVNMVSRTVMTYPNDIRGISIDAGLTNVQMTLNKCSLDFTDASACDWAYAVNVSGNGTGHTVTVNGGTYEGANVINVHGANNTVVVKNATLTSLYPNNDVYYGACIWVLQNQGSEVTAIGNTFNGNNAIAFNLGTGTNLTESNNIDNTTICVAKIGDKYYTSLKDAFEAAVDGNTIKVLHNIALAESITNTKNVTLDLNGKTITGTDNATGSFGLFTNRGELTITGNGKITLKATNDRDWNAYSSVISNQPGGKLIVENGTIEHLGGTDMAYGIDNLTNGKGTYAETVVNGGTVKSTYRAIRQFLNGIEAQNILTVNGGTIEGANKSIWMQDPSAKANSGKLTVLADASLKGDVYLSVTEGSTEWPVEVSIANAAFADGYTVITENIPEKYVVKNNNGIWGVFNAVAKVGETTYASLADAANAANGAEITIIRDFEEVYTVADGANVKINFGVYTMTGSILAPNANLTVANGTIINNDKGVSAIEINAGTLTLDGVKVSSARHAVRIDGAVTATINGGEYTLITSAGVTQHALNVSGTASGKAYVIINDGKFVGPKGTDSNSGRAINVQTGAEVTINGGLYSGGKNETLKSVGELEVYGGKYDQDVKEYCAPARICKANDDSVYKYIVEPGLDGSGTETDPFLITNLTELEYFNESVNKGETTYKQEGVWVALGADIDMTSVANWAPIGSFDVSYDGNFNGQGHKIMNLKMSDNVAATGESYLGFFGVTANNVIKNFVIENVTIESKGQIVAAAIAYPYYTTVSDITVCGDIAIKGGNYTAGVLAYTRLCVNASNLTVSGNSGSYITGTQVVGGVIADIQMNHGLVANYSNFSASGLTITGTKCVGGISGIISAQTLNGATVKNIVLNSEDNFAGIVAGRMGDPSTISGVVFESVTGATAVIGATYDGPKAIEARIVDTYYATLEAALLAEGNNVTLLVPYTVEADETVVLDLNGKTVTMEDASAATSAMIKNYGNLTISNGKLSFKATAPSANNAYASNTISNYGTITVLSGIIENTSVGGACYALDNYAGSTATIEGGKLIAEKTTLRVFNWTNGEAAKATLNIQGGEIVSNDGYGVNLNLGNSPYVDLNITGGTITTNDTDYSLAVYVVNKNSAENININVEGGIFNGNFALNGVTATTMAEGKVSISGGTFEGVICYETPAYGFITGGAFVNNPSDYCAENYGAVYNGEYFIVKLISGTQTREFASAGWHWFSTYINLEGADGLKDLQNALVDENGNCVGKQIKGQDGFTQYFSGYNAWSPGLPAITTAEMYMVNVTAPVTVELTGDFVDYENRYITLTPGWNWIGYPVRETVAIKNAFAAPFTPSDGDIIKPKSGTGSQYYEAAGGWFPSFNLVPGHGYKYLSVNPTTTGFYYTTENNSRGIANDNVIADNRWNPAASEFAENMVVIAMLNINGEVAGENYEVAAFANGVCRGSARPIYNEKLDKHILFMTINGEEVEELTFKCYNINSDEVFELNDVITYSNDAVLGSLKDPYIFNCSTLGIGENSLNDINIYPNPTTRDRAINLQATCDNVEVFNALGVKVAEYQNVDTIDALETAGVYVIRVTINGETRNCRLVVE